MNLVRPLTTTFCLIAIASCGGGSGGGTLAPAPAPAPGPGPVRVALDLADPINTGDVSRVSGAASTGRFGVPVASGFDMDGDGFVDVAMSGMQAAPFGRAGAGVVTVVFGDGSIGVDVDTAVANPRVLTVAGGVASEAAGGEIWMDDVTGDGLGDLIIGRHNHTAPANDRIGAGALSIVVGNAMLRDLASAGTILDLASPPPGVTVLTLLGAAALDRLGFWMRTGDLTGDGIADLAVSADQEDGPGEPNRGALYLVRGGAHLDAAIDVDLAEFGATLLAGHIARVLPPAGSTDYHFGATLAFADLDANGRAELLSAASLSRVGGLLEADGAPTGSGVRNGGNPGGSLFIFWDDNFPAGASWPAGLTLDPESAPGGITRIDGGSVTGVFENLRFGEELLGGLDYDGDGAPDLFAGDIKGTASGDRIEGGVGHVFFSAAALVGRTFSMSDVPADLSVTHILGPSIGAIGCDTSLHGDIDADGLDDLVVASPLANPHGRIAAGIAHVLWGRSSSWPAVIDLADGSRPDPATFAITDIDGARGAASSDDAGDTLMYSAVGADVDGDGRTDLVINEMRGNGFAVDAVDVGNLLIVDGAAVPR